LSFPDVNVWLALVAADHIHRPLALSWWDQADGTIAFGRFTQMGLLRLLTTAPVMNDKPLSMTKAWKVYDRRMQDERVAMVPETSAVERPFRQYASGVQSSPKLWADAYLLAFAQQAAGVLGTFDKGIARRSADVRLLVCARLPFYNTFTPINRNSPGPRTNIKS
jgi:toxin-antitoxin system PIN domain toxin